MCTHPRGAQLTSWGVCGGGGLHHNDGSLVLHYCWRHPSCSELIKSSFTLTCVRPFPPAAAPAAPHFHKMCCGAPAQPRPNALVPHTHLLLFPLQVPHLILLPPPLRTQPAAGLPAQPSPCDALPNACIGVSTHLLLLPLHAPHLILLRPHTRCLFLPPLQCQRCSLSLGQEFGLQAAGGSQNTIGVGLSQV